MSSARVFVRNGSLKDYGGQYLEIGEVFHLKNALHDEKLLENRYVSLVDKDSERDLSTCTPCGKVFINDGYRNNHAERVRHPAIDLEVGPLKQSRGLDVTAEGPERELEPVGAPSPTRAEETGAMPGTRRGTAGAGSKANETFRLG